MRRNQRLWAKLTWARGNQHGVFNGANNDLGFDPLLAAQLFHALQQYAGHFYLKSMGGLMAIPLPLKFRYQIGFLDLRIAKRDDLPVSGIQPDGFLVNPQ